MSTTTTEPSISQSKVMVALSEVGECVRMLAELINSPDNPLKRGQIAVMLERAAQRLVPGPVNQLGDIHDFHTKFGLAYAGDPRLLPRDLHIFRVSFMEEELQEFDSAYMDDDLTKALDALVDLDYVLKGTVHLMGLSAVYPRGWARVHRANMQKIRAEKPGDSKRGSTFDVIKPEGWIAPDLSDLVK
jgi:predicted HAD superfamily Cof-like phosphohydrolase